MRRILTAAAVSALLTAALTGCGTEDGTDASEWGTGEIVGASPGASPTESTEPEVSGSPRTTETGDDTISKSALNEEQTTLHAEMLLFEDIAKAEASEGNDAGSASASFRDADEDDAGDWLKRPDGIRVAQAYVITWSNGKINTYTLTTDSGERMTYEAGRISLDVTVDSPRDSELERSAQELERAVADWVDQHGKPPAVSHGSGRTTLSEGFFGESDIAEVEVAFEGDITMAGSFNTNDEYTVHLRSNESQEDAWLTQDGLKFSRLHEIV